MTALRIENLSVSVASGKQDQVRWPVLHNISLELKSGEMLGLVGESGCGKSVTALSVLRLLPQPTLRVDSGAIIFNETNLLALDPKQLRQLRGNNVAMIFQDPMTALNPVQTIGKQVEEVLLLHRPQWSKQQRRQRIIELLERVRIPAPSERLNAYPHQLSGGMRQRVMIAMALACEPQLLIADEPTTALDVTVQAQVLDLIRELQRESNMAVLLITHDLGVIAETCQRVAVMYAGRIVEQASVEELFEQPRHPYTQGLLASLPARAAQPQTPLATIGGQVPDIDARPPGCAFSNRCAWRSDICSEVPVLEGESHAVACFHWQHIATENAQ
ncbi:MAG: peptide transporter ATP-binding protein [Verrucomicrobiaceae bacterium]|nr:peptide transporter ATP-binding protein [Verrucomicrobiaceae bacterium]